MRIPSNAERISFRTANTHRPAVIEPSYDYGDGFSPRQARFGENDERYTLALAGRLKLNAESGVEGFGKEATEEKTTYTGVTCNGDVCRAAVAVYQADSGDVSFSEYKFSR